MAHLQKNIASPMGCFFVKTVPLLVDEELLSSFKADRGLKDLGRPFSSGGSEGFSLGSLDPIRFVGGLSLCGFAKRCGVHSGLFGMYGQTGWGVPLCGGAVKRRCPTMPPGLAPDIHFRWSSCELRFLGTRVHYTWSRETRKRHARASRGDLTPGQLSL